MNEYFFVALKRVVLMHWAEVCYVYALKDCLHSQCLLRVTRCCWTIVIFLLFKKNVFIVFNYLGFYLWAFYIMYLTLFSVRCRHLIVGHVLSVMYCVIFNNININNNKVLSCGILWYYLYTVFYTFCFCTFYMFEVVNKVFKCECFRLVHSQRQSSSNRGHSVNVGVTFCY